jgi:hypothetical protein
VTVTAIADAWFLESSADANKGDDSSLKVQSKLGGDAFRALVRFPLLAVPEGCELASAELRLFADGPKPGRTVEVHRVVEPWAEMSVTWPTQPATGGPVSTAPSGSEKGWRSWSVSGQVAEMYAGGAFHGFLVRDAVENEDSEQTYNSRETGENVPTLVVRFRPAA